MDKPEPDAVSDERGLHGDYPVTLESNWNLIDSQKQTIDTLTAERDELQTKLEAAAYFLAEYRASEYSQGHPWSDDVMTALANLEQALTPAAVHDFKHKHSCAWFFPMWAEHHNKPCTCTPAAEIKRLKALKGNDDG